MNFFIFLQKNNYSRNTITTYRSIILQYRPFWHDIRQVRKHLLSKTPNPNTAWTHYNVLLVYMKFTKDKRIQKLKEIKLPPIPQVYKPVLTKSAIYKKTANLTDVKCAIIRFLFETGLRAEELKHIEQIKKHTLIVIGKGNKKREVFHNRETTSLIPNQDFNFSTKTLRIWVKQILGKKYTPHSIRRSHATHMLLKGATPKSVMMQLGHCKVETTYKYLQLSMKTNKRIYDKYF